MKNNIARFVFCMLLLFSFSDNSFAQNTKTKKLKAKAALLKKQVKEKKVKEEKDTVKKKKGAKFLKGLKEAAKNASDLGMSLELKKVTNVDLHKIAKDYLKAIKTTQNSYSLTSKDRADLAKVKAAKEKKYADIKKANDAYWASPEGQRLRESYRKDGGSSKSKPAKAGVKTVSVMVNPNGKATNFVHIHWTENGSSRKKTLQTRSTSSIGNIPENTKLYYTTDNGTNKVYFFTVPSGKSNASVTIK